MNEKTKYRLKMRVARAVFNLNWWAFTRAYQARGLVGRTISTMFFRHVTLPLHERAGGWAHRGRP